MLGLSLGHIIVLVIIVLIFGPKRVSSLGAQLGKTVRGLRESLDDAKRDMGISEVTNPINEMRDEFSKLKEEASNPLKTSGKIKGEFDPKKDEKS